jgi:hypothetical protein
MRLPPGGRAVNSFQLLTLWVVGSAICAGCVWLLVWAVNRLWFRRASAIGPIRPYQIDGPFVEICVADGYSLADLRALFESIRDDPRLPPGALLVFDSSARAEVLSDADVRSRLAVFLDILRPRMVPAFAAIASSAIASSARASQQYAAAVGVRVELFLDLERARDWLSTCAPTADRL